VNLVAEAVLLIIHAGPQHEALVRSYP